MKPALHPSHVWCAGCQEPAHALDTAPCPVPGCQDRTHGNAACPAAHVAEGHRGRLLGPGRWIVPVEAQP